MAPLTLRGKALAWLAQREHSRLELEQKLKRYASKIEARVLVIGPVLDALEAAGHLSEARFVESRVNARLARFGNRRIEQELRAKGAAPDEATRAQLRDSELARAKRVFAAKFSRVLPTTDFTKESANESANESNAEPPLAAKERARQVRFLAARGFSAATIAQVLKEAGLPEDLDG